MELPGHIVDVLHQTIFPGILIIAEGRIQDIRREPVAADRLILPGFIDAHLHIESTLLVPAEFARIAAINGTVAAVCDPHEIANVLGEQGLSFMIENSGQTPFSFFFGVPSCVPACGFDSSGAEFDAETVARLLARKEFGFLAEVMNFPGVLQADPAVMAKVAAAGRYNKPVDGHAPGLRGRDLDLYLRAGISTDHETIHYDEGREKLAKGMHLLIREGSAARNFEALIPLLDEFPEQCMFCTDDIYPDELLAGHINLLVRRALAKGIDRWKVLRAACLNPVRHYGLDTGLLRIGDFADCIVIDNFAQCTVLQTFFRGELVAENGRSCQPKIPAARINRFAARPKTPADFAVPQTGNRLRVIGAFDGQIFTRCLEVPVTEGGWFQSDTDRDILKIAVVNRYADCLPAVGAIKNFGLKRGALASSVSHDSHNIVAVGVDDHSLCRAVNAVIENRGGLVVVAEDEMEVLPLPIAGLMSDQDYPAVAEQFARLNRLARALGTTLQAPFMTLSFMCLPVVPELKLTDKGLFDGRQFRYTELFGRV